MAGPLTNTVKALTNAHTHSFRAPSKGITRSRPFDQWFADTSSRGDRDPTIEETSANALVTGLENLESGNTAIVDHLVVPHATDHVYAAANAYETLGIRALVLVDCTDIPRLCYTKEYYPKFPRAIALADLPEEMRARIKPFRPYQEMLAAVREMIAGWKGTRVRLGLALGSAVWCSDGLLRDAAAMSKELDVPVSVHAEESPVQREVCFAQWGMSGIRRLAEFGVLSPRAIVAHCVQVDDEDARLLASSGANVVHNPISNMKLQNGVAPVGKLLDAGVNVCLGSDGASSGDDQNLYPVMRFVAAMGRINGLKGELEEQVLAMATSLKLLDASQDRVELSRPVGPFAHAWSDLSPLIREVHIAGAPVLAKARETVRAAKAYELVTQQTEEAAHPDRAARGERFAAAVAGYSIAR